jgi:hypothetical protein
MTESRKKKELYVPCSLGSACWLICRNEEASKKIVATGILVFDFELFIGVRYYKAHIVDLFCPHNGLSVIIGLLWSNINGQLSYK